MLTLIPVQPYSPYYTLLTLTVPVKRQNSPLFDKQTYKTIPTMQYLPTQCIMDYYWLSAGARPD